MKNKILPLKDGMQISSCGSCHDKTIEAQWCLNCIDRPAVSKYTLNPVQTEVYNILEENPYQSIIVASKTGTGKTICAYQAIHRYYEQNLIDSTKPKKIIWLNPLKQIVREKVEELNEIFEDKAILELTGDTSDEVGYGRRRNQYIKDNSIIVCSYEMFDSLTRNPIVYTEMNNIGLIVIDEIHSIGDASRGGKLDGALTRFLLKHKDVQIVALSATFDNIDDLQNYFNQFLNNPIKIVTNAFTPIFVRVDPEMYIYTKDNIPLFVELVGNYLNKEGGIMCMQLSIPGCKKLEAAINNVYGPGTARVHFSELQKEEKYKTVDDFNDGKFKVLCCTPTLLSGVNVAATTIILNLSYFNPLTLEPAILPATSIKQAIGRVGRPPRYKEGFVSYICQVDQLDVAEAILQSDNVVNGSLNNALEQVLNIEISLKTQTFDEISTWYLHTYSGFSSSTSPELLGEALKWLVHHEFIKIDNESPTGQGKIISILPKGKACAKNFVEPKFFEACITLMTSPITSTDDILATLATLYDSASAPFNWNERKQKQFMDNCNFNWLHNEYGQYDFIRNKTPIQWADQIEFAMHSVASAAKDLNLKSLVEVTEIIETCMEESLIPFPLIQLKHKLDQFGIPNLGSKYLLYLYLNGVKVIDGRLTGPDGFRTPRNAEYVGDQYYNVTFNSGEIRFAHAAVNLKKYYGMEEKQTEVITDEW
jgi:superfamily II DNA/RNA helicase